MNTQLAVGDRVTISENYHWAKGVLSTIKHHPINGPDHSSKIYREVTAVRGVLSFYWVRFDEPQLDTDGDGPYQEAEIDSNYLIRV